VSFGRSLTARSAHVDFFKRTHVCRMLDMKRNTLVYLAISNKLIDGLPQNAISTLPIMQWGAAR
jgi:CreA protein